MSFNKEDRVRIVNAHHSKNGELGTVNHVYEDGAYIVRMDHGGGHHGFFEAEMELVDEKREALIELAETLNKARLQANAIDEYVIQSQRGVYGTIVLALGDTLQEIVGGGLEATRDAISNRVYYSILDGNTVREALAVVKK